MKIKSDGNGNDKVAAWHDNRQTGRVALRRVMSQAVGYQVTGPHHLPPSRCRICHEGSGEATTSSCASSDKCLCSGVQGVSLRPAPTAVAETRSPKGYLVQSVAGGGCGGVEGRLWVCHVRTLPSVWRPEN